MRASGVGLGEVVLSSQEYETTDYANTTLHRLHAKRISIRGKDSVVFHPSTSCSHLLFVV